jgi:4-amino-4-deoxychorismate lyase
MEPKAKHLFWYDGQLLNSPSLTLAIDDPALIYGASIFTTMRVYHSDLSHSRTFWQQHIQRLRVSLDAFDWEFSDWQRLEQGVIALLPFSPVLRITIFPNGRELIQGRNLPPDLDHNKKSGVVGRVVDSFYDRSLGSHKTGNYLGPWLALQSARKHGAKEGILTDSHGSWLETSTGNLWGYDGHSWYTPSLSSTNGTSILSGITRTYILESLQRDGLPTQEVIWNLELVRKFTVIAYSNCVIELIPFRQIHIDETQLEFSVNNPALSQLQNYFC